MPARPTVLIGPSSFAAVDQAPLKRLEQAGMEIIRNPYGRKLTKEELHALLPGVVGLVAGLEPLTRDVLEKSGLKVISRCGSGVSNVDLDAARELGIEVRATPDAPTAAVAELTVGAMIVLMRRLIQMDRDLHAGQWVKQVGWQLQGKTVTIIGFGRIGRKVAELLRPFQVRLLAVERAEGIAPTEGVEFRPLEAALPEADIVTLHASGEQEIIGESELAVMKPGAYLLNAARGELINEAALCRALERKLVAGAWLDTFAQEPYDGPFRRYPQVLLSPHIGSSSVECRSRMEMESVENLLAAFASLGVGHGGRR